MSFLVTARKYRPQRFDEVVGQEHITTTLINALKSGRVAHAYLFTGPRGVGKTTTARILAKSLNCANPQDYEPCNKCDMCLSIQNSQLMDIIEIDAASNRGIDEIRALRESVKYSPTKGKYKVYIIDEVHMLTKESFNAFLKTLEEPPSHTVFIFATTDIQKVPATIISRCQRYDFRRIQLDVTKKLLLEVAKKENINIDDKTLTIIARKAEGGLRDAESFFDQTVAFCGNNVDYETVVKILNLIDDEVYFTLSDAVIGKDFPTAFTVSNIIYENGWNFIDFTEGLITHFRNIMTVVVTNSTKHIETAEVYEQKYLNYEEQFSESDLLRILNYLTKLQSELRFSQNHKLKIEVALCHIIGLERSLTLSKLISEIETTKEINTKSVAITADNKVKEKPVTQQSIEREPIYQPKPKSGSDDPFNKISVSEPDTLFNFDTIIKKWDSFVKAVNTEKSLVIGPLISQLLPVGLDRNQINVVLKDESGKVIYSSHRDYVDKKLLEHFGKNFELNFVESDAETQASITPKSPPKQTNKKVVSKFSDEDPLIQAIKTELGGEEYN